MIEIAGGILLACLAIMLWPFILIGLVIYAVGVVIFLAFVYFDDSPSESEVWKVAHSIPIVEVVKPNVESERYFSVERCRTQGEGWIPWAQSRGYIGSPDFDWTAYCIEKRLKLGEFRDDFGS